MSALELLIYALATYRLTMVVVQETGPFDVFMRLRQVGKPFTCEYCFSIWAGLGFVLLRVWRPDVADVTAIVFALSALAIGMKSAAEGWIDIVQTITHWRK